MKQRSLSEGERYGGKRKGGSALTGKKPHKRHIRRFGAKTTIERKEMKTATQMKTGLRKLICIVAAAALAVMMIPAMAFAENAGSITINTTGKNVSLEGKTFNAYKILDLKMVGNNGYVYTVPSELESFYANELGVSANAGDFDYQVTQKIQAKDKESQADLFAFAAKALTAAKNAGISPSGTATGAKGDSYVTISNLTDGYYVIEDTAAKTPVSALMLQTVNNPNETVTIKADEPTVDKKIVDNAQGANPTTANNAAIGDTVYFQVTSKVPDMTGYTKYFFVMNDTLSKGLEFGAIDSIVVGEKTLKANTDYTLETNKDNNNGTTSIEIVFKNFIQYTKGADITITYHATVDEDAEIGTAGNDNTVKLQYSNNPNVTPSGELDNPDKPKSDDPTGDTPEKKTQTFVTGIELIKVNPAGERLTGATFEITGEKLNKVLVEQDTFTEAADGKYWLLKDGSYTTTEPVTDENAVGYNAGKYADTVKKYTKSKVQEVKATKENVKAEATVGADGVLRFNGLAAGEYTINEIKAPDGYNLLASPIQLKIEWTAPTDTAKCTWTYTWKQGNDNLTPVENAENTVQIVNNTGSQLPSTGGIGTTIFYVGGAILIIGAIAALIIKRRNASHSE